MAQRIFIRVSHERAYVWDVEDIKKLRSQHRMCGLLGGTLPHLSQQNVFLGMPLILMPEEVVLLVKKGLAVIVDDAHAHHRASKDEGEEWNRTRKKEQQQELAQKGSVSGGVSAQKSMTEEAIMKRRQREERRLAALAKTSGGNSESGESTFAASSHISRPPTPVSVSASSMPYTVKIPTSSTALKWYKPSRHCYHTIEEARAANVWSYPSSELERARCGVYQALWEKGYYMGCGIKFGGDYLVYPGDLLRYHSHFVASVLESASYPLRPMEIVAHGRLGTATKKAHLLCSWDDKTQKADIFSIEWAGFG